MRHIVEMPKPAYHRLVSRIKAVCRMDIAERRKPQDGRATVLVHGAGYELRASTLPTPDGERVSIRVLDQDRPMLALLEDLGLEADVLEQLKEVIRHRQGLVLVAHPVGSGRTTTLYAALEYLRGRAGRIATVEHPVEYRLPGVTQVEVDHGAGISFASGLRSILGHHADVVMVGEIKDRQTAHLALQAAGAGRLVLSTIDAGDAREALTRLLEMGLPAPLVASSLAAVLAQRLARRLCSCAIINLDGTASAKGCEVCRSSGYKGHTGVFELMRVGRFMRAAIVNGVSARELADVAEMSATGTMFADGQRKVVRRITTLGEVRRVVPATEPEPEAPAVARLRPAITSSSAGLSVVPRAAFRISPAASPEFAEEQNPSMAPRIDPTPPLPRPVVGAVTLPSPARVSRPPAAPAPPPAAPRSTALWRVSRMG